MSTHHHSKAKFTPNMLMLILVLLLAPLAFAGNETPLPADPDGILNELTNENKPIARRNPRLSGIATPDDRGILDHIEVNPVFDYSTLPSPFNTLLAGLDITPPSVTFTDLTSYYDCYDEGSLNGCGHLWQERRLALPAEYGQKASDDVDKAWEKFNLAMAKKIHEHVNQVPACVINVPSCLLWYAGVPQPPPLPNYACAVPRVMTGIAEGLALYYPTYVIEVFTAVMKHLPLHVSYGAHPINFFDPLPGSINAALYKISLSSLEEMLEDYQLDGGTLGGWLDEDGNFAGSREDLYYFESILKQMGLDLPVLLLPSEGPKTFGVDAWEIGKENRFGEANTPYMYENVGYVEIWNLTAPRKTHFIAHTEQHILLHPHSWHLPSIRVPCSELPILYVPVLLFPVPAPAEFGKFEHAHLIIEEGGVIPHTSKPMNSWGDLSVFD